MEAVYAQSNLHIKSWNTASATVLSSTLVGANWCSLTQGRIFQSTVHKPSILNFSGSQLMLPNTGKSFNQLPTNLRSLTSVGANLYSLTQERIFQSTAHNPSILNFSGSQLILPNTRANFSINCPQSFDSQLQWEPTYAP